MLTASPPSSFTPAHWASAQALTIFGLWGILTDVSCGRLDRTTILCSITFPPINGKYLGWDTRIHWNGHRVIASELVVPEA